MATRDLADGESTQVQGSAAKPYTLKNHPLDGELWVGRKLFQDTISIVRRFDKSEEWKKVSYVLFDAPAMDEPFEDFAWPETQEKKGSGKSRAAGANPANPPGAARNKSKKA